MPLDCAIFDLVEPNFEPDDGQAADREAVFDFASGRHETMSLVIASAAKQSSLNDKFASLRSLCRFLRDAFAMTATAIYLNGQHALACVHIASDTDK